MSEVSQTIEILVSPSGETTVQTKGFVGARCRDASGFIEQALGERTGERLTAEFYNLRVAPQQQLGQQDN
jgi:hypothetical protein